MGHPSVNPIILSALRALMELAECRQNTCSKVRHGSLFIKVTAFQIPLLIELMKISSLPRIAYEPADESG